MPMVFVSGQSLVPLSVLCWMRLAVVVYPYCVLIKSKHLCVLFSAPQMWINPCAQVIFDSDPAPKDMSAPQGVEMMSQAMIR